MHLSVRDPMNSLARGSDMTEPYETLDAILAVGNVGNVVL